MSDTFVKSGLREKRADMARQIVEARAQIDRLQADLFHPDSVLRLYGEEPEDIPLKGRIGKLSPYFGRAEMSRRCRDALRRLAHGQESWIIRPSDQIPPSLGGLQ